MRKISIYHRRLLAFSRLLDPEYLHHFVPEVIDHLDCDAAGAGFLEGAGGIAVEGGPGVGVDLGFERCFQRGVGIVLA